MNTGDTISVRHALVHLYRREVALSFFSSESRTENVPDGKNTTSLLEVALLLHTSDALLKDGRDLGGGGLSIGGVGADTGCNSWGDESLFKSAQLVRLGGLHLSTPRRPLEARTAPKTASILFMSWIDTIGCVLGAAQGAGVALEVRVATYGRDCSARTSGGGSPAALAKGGPEHDDV